MSNDFDALFSTGDSDRQQPAQKKQPTAKTKKKRGRPATGKRSDEGWISRAFYIEESTDIDIEMELALLRREGIKMDKSELVNQALIAWLKYRQGEKPSTCLGEISKKRS